MFHKALTKLQCISDYFVSVIVVLCLLYNVCNGEKTFIYSKMLIIIFASVQEKMPDLFEKKNQTIQI